MRACFWLNIDIQQGNIYVSKWDRALSNKRIKTTG